MIRRAIDALRISNPARLTALSAVFLLAVLADAVVVSSTSAAHTADECAQVRAEVATNELRLAAAQQAGGLTSGQRAELANEQALDAAALRHCPISPTPSATTASASASPQPTVTASPQPTVTASPSASTGQACPALPAYPTPACTGAITAEANMSTTTGSINVTVAGTRIEKRIITGDLTVSAPNVTVVDSIIYHGVMVNDGASLSITDTTVGPPSGCDTGGFAVGWQHFQALRVEVRNMGDGFRNGGDNVRVDDSYVKTCAPAGSGAHSDAYQANGGGTNVVINHSTLDMRADDPCCWTAALFSDGISAGQTLTNNLLAGGGYTIQLDGVGPWVVTGNRAVDRSWQYDYAHHAALLELHLA
jgi:hypothetical protein